MPEGTPPSSIIAEKPTARRLPKGESDAVHINCACPPDSGTVVLFYRYFQNTPHLPSSIGSTTHARLITSDQTSELAAWYESVCTTLQLTGKVRVAREGYNCTIAGSCQAIKQFIRLCCAHWSFAGLDLDRQDDQKVELDIKGATDESLSIKETEIFKPSPGCHCVFEGRLSIRQVQEICPLGQPTFTPSDWQAPHNAQATTELVNPEHHVDEAGDASQSQNDTHHKIHYLSPAEWHARVLDQSHSTTIIDIRNKYESNLGHFVVPPDTSHRLILPPTRKFSELPDYLKAHPHIFIDSQDEASNKAIDHSSPVNVQDVLTYCTGGIRCEKGARWIRDKASPINLPITVATLEGGIAAYLKWMDDNITAGTMKPEDSLFKGRNYVFDARGSTGLKDIEVEHVATCIKCHVPSSELGKCYATYCHLVLIVCEKCREEPGSVWCCVSCKALDHEDQITGKRRSVCECEKERDLSMIGGPRIKSVKKSGWRRGKNRRLEVG